MLPRMNLLLEAAAGQADQTGAIITGIVVWVALLSLLATLVGFGSARPHTVSERE